MLNNSNQDPIQKFILESQDNLRIASEVYEALPRVKSQIASEFLGRLENRLKIELNGCIMKRIGNFFEENETRFEISMASWKRRSLALIFWKYGRSMAIGIRRDTDNKTELPLSQPLLNEVQKIFPSAKSWPWWEAWCDLHSPAVDWSRHDVLWQMYQDEQFLEEVAVQILEIAKISKPFIEGVGSQI